MRMAAIPVLYQHDAAKAIEIAGDSSKTTHGARQAVDCCRYLSALVVGALNGRRKEDLLEPLFLPATLQAGNPQYWTTNPLDDEVQEVANGSYKSKDPPDIVGSGHCVRSLEAALWAFHKSDTFREGCLLAVNLGDDAGCSLTA